MPRGSDYGGPPDALEAYAAVVDRSSAGVDLKGAKNPYTSRNGHMHSFLDADGMMALRLSEADTEEFMDRYESGPVHQYGRLMHGYVSVPGDLLHRPDELVAWFDRSHDWIGTLEPKPTR